MFTKEQYEQLLSALPSFYQDFLPLDNSLMKVIEAYATTINYVWEVLQEAEDATHISTARTVSTVPYYKINIDEGMYSLQIANMVAKLDFEKQIQYLDNERKYVQLTFDVRDNAGEPVVYGMRLFTNFSDKTPLRLYDDYFLRANRLYLLPSYIQKRQKAVHYLHAFDIKYNDNTLEKNFGTRFSIQAGPLLPRFEYRDVLEAFIRVFREGMTIKSIREGIKLATKWEKFELEDFKSPTLSAQKRQLYKDWLISPRKFILSLPEELIADKIKVNIVRTLLNEAKEVQTDFMVFFDIERFDKLQGIVKPYPKIAYQRKDETAALDRADIQKLQYVFREYPLELYGRYDSVFSFDYNLRYDDPPANEIVGLKQRTKNVIDQTSPTNQCKVTHYTLCIPRQFKATRNTSTNKITFSMNCNLDTTTHFELHAATSKNGPYELIETVANNTNNPTISFQHNAIGSGKLYYRSRSKDPQSYSLFTVPVNINEI